MSGLIKKSRIHKHRKQPFHLAYPLTRKERIAKRKRQKAARKVQRGK